MNFLLHFLFNYAFLTFAFGDVNQYLPVIFIASVALDFDHIPYILKVRGKLIQKKFGSESRTWAHELLGLGIVSIALSLASLFINLLLVKILALSVVLHYSLDFLFGKTRPFYPFSKEEVFVGICPEKFRIPAEILLTGIFAVIFWLLMTR